MSTSTTQPVDGTTTGPRPGLAAVGIGWFLVSSLWLVDLCVRGAAQTQVLVGGRTLALAAVALVASAGWGLLLGAGRRWRLLVTSAAAGFAVALLGAAVLVVTVLGDSSEVNPEALWAVVPVLTVGGWAALVAVLVTAAAAGRGLTDRDGR
jgi:hypothetical protein